MSTDPYIEKPDEHLPDERDLFCFVDASRPCKADCMAFMPYPPEGDDYKGQQWPHCMILVQLHKGGKHLTALAQQGAALLKSQRIKAADAKRESQPLPPPVR